MRLIDDLLPHRYSRKAKKIAEACKDTKVKLALHRALKNREINEMETADWIIKMNRDEVPF